MVDKICYVTAFYDMRRDMWPIFTRTFDDYLACFKPMVSLFEKASDKFEMIVYIDDKHLKAVIEATSMYSQIKLIPINDTFMKENIPMWKTLDRERTIMNSVEFKQLIPHRTKFPEHSIPEYSLINHCKIDL